MLRLTTLGTYVQTQHDDRDLVVDRGEIDIIHDQTLVVGEARLSVDVGIAKRWGLSVVLPVRRVSSRIDYFDDAGASVELVNDGIHHRNEALVGLADPMVLGSHGDTLGGIRLVGRAGFTVPLGRTEGNPFVSETMAHQHIQMGTGTVNAVLSAEAGKSWGDWRLGGFVFSQQTFYENGKGYQAGDRYAAGLVLRRRLGTSFSVRGGLEMQAETAERWDSVIHTDDGNRGRIDAMLATGVAWSATDELVIDLGLKIPFVTHAVGGQLDMPAILELGVSYSFGGAKPKPAVADTHDHEHGEHEHEHEHEHEEHADAKPGPKPRGDIADLGKPGEAVELRPANGKLTMFDFWATWCEPCKELEPALVELARAHPDKIALRRIDIVDWDSAAVAKHLSPKGFDLPHVKIVDASGKVIFERSSGKDKLADLIRAIRELVTAKTR